MSHSYCAHGIDVENYHCLKCPPSPLDKLLDVLTDHIATLESAGFGSSTSTISITTVVHAINDNFEKLRDALAAVERPKHGDPIGGFAKSDQSKEQSR